MGWLPECPGGILVEIGLGFNATRRTTRGSGDQSVNLVVAALRVAVSGETKARTWMKSWG